ncbi:MFS transporter [Burkholderia sp. Ax-1719]|uniref:MFS transporter n=1 Tax=Burkholderia sp. Ax-1719 TaxID=2608334 RepID=UPI0014237555|nr:MFS transporter [Burkholderia sp. Ax-1719]NIE63067.1 MFS transporter [Burkholderia sp. Ax-1719]
MEEVAIRTPRTAQEDSSLGKVRLWIMAIAAGISVANIYYNQPLLDQFRSTFSVTQSAIGWVPTLTQLGYALGMLFLVPLGDKLYRKRLVVTFVSIASLVGFAISLAPTLHWLVALSFVFGLSTMAPQLLVPFAAHLAAPEERGRTVGFMVSGILLGILLARTVSGFVGGAFGWRIMFALAGATQAIAALVLLRTLPHADPTYKGSYVSLLRTVWNLVREQPVLREACLFGAMLFGSFMVFWSSLIHLMESPAFHLGPRTTGLYGLLGAAAALMSPWIGSLTDRANPRKMAGLMIVIAIDSYLIFYFGRSSLILVGVGVLVMDLGVQLGHVTNQSRIFSLVPGAQSRIQTAYMFSYFLGGAIGSAFGSYAWSHWGWGGVCFASVAMLTIALGRWLLPAPR